MKKNEPFGHALAGEPGCRAGAVSQYSGRVDVANGYVACARKRRKKHMKKWRWMAATVPAALLAGSLTAMAAETKDVTMAFCTWR